MRLLLDAIYNISLARYLPDEFFYSVTSSGVFWLTGSNNTPSGTCCVSGGNYYLYITESQFTYLLNRYPSTASLLANTGSLNPCSGAYGPPTNSLSGSGPFTGSYCLPI